MRTLRPLVRTRQFSRGWTTFIQENIDVMEMKGKLPAFTYLAVRFWSWTVCWRMGPSNILHFSQVCGQVTVFISAKQCRFQELSEFLIPRKIFKPEENNDLHPLNSICIVLKKIYKIKWTLLTYEWDDTHENWFNLNFEKVRMKSFVQKEFLRR